MAASAASAADDSALSIELRRSPSAAALETPGCWLNAVLVAGVVVLLPPLTAGTARKTVPAGRPPPSRRPRWNVRVAVDVVGRLAGTAVGSPSSSSICDLSSWLDHEWADDTLPAAANPANRAVTGVGCDAERPQPPLQLLGGAP